MLTTVIFDLSDVFLEGILGSHKFFEEKLSTPVSEEYFYNEGFKKFMLGQLTEDEYWKSVIKKNSWDIPISHLKKAARKNFTEIKGTRKIIEELKQSGYKLGLLSNHAKEWIVYCETTYKYHNLFHEVLYSYEVSFSKPDKNIFFLMLKKLNVKPEECLFIDDYIKNIESAKQLGIETIHFTSPDKLKKQLRELKLLKSS